MSNLIQCEMMKLRKSVPLRILFLLMLALGLVSSMSSLSYVNSPVQQELEIALHGCDAFFSSLRDMPTIVMIGVLVLVFVVTNDFENRTIQAAICAGHSRTAILISKMLAFAVGYLAVYLPYPLIRAIVQGMLMGFGAPVSAALIFKMAASLIVILLSGMAVNSVVFWLAFTVRRSILVVGAGFVIVVLGTTALMSFAYSLPQLGSLLAYTPIGFFRELALGNYTPALLGRAAGMDLAVLVLTLFFSHVCFRHEDIR